MKIIDLQKQSATVSSTASITLGSAVAPFRTVAQAIAAGDLAAGEAGVAFFVRDPASGAWESGYYTVTNATTLTREKVVSSSNGNAAVAFGGAACEVFSAAPGDYLAGTPLTDYLAAHDGGAVGNTDILPIARGASLFGVTLSAVASAVLNLFATLTEKQVQIASTAQLRLDFTQHNRARIVCTAVPSSIAGPVTFSNVGNGFTCRIENQAGADIALSGITVRPSGTVIPAGAWADVYATNGALYANVGGTAAAASTVAPGQVTGLTAGTATDTTQPLTWAAPATGTAPFTYKVEYKRQADSTWTVANASVSGTSYTVTGLTASTPYDYRVSASNGAGTGAVSTTASKSTTAASASTGGGSAPFSPTATAGNFPSVLKTYSASSFYEKFNLNSGATVTAASAVAGLSESSTVPPTPAISMANAVGSRGVWLGTITNYNNTGNWLAGIAAGTAQTVSADVPTPITLYFWVFITDSAGTVWKYVYLNGIQVGNNVTNAALSADAPATLVP